MSSNNLTRRIRRNLQARMQHYGLCGRGQGCVLEALGCTIPELKRYLRKQFLAGMNWENYGEGEGRWNIDHIIPISFSKMLNFEQARKLCNYRNLRPMWAIDNNRKGCR